MREVATGCWSRYIARVTATRRNRWPITITEIGRQNIEEKHRRGGSFSAGKSIFRNDLTVEEIVAPAEYVRPTLQATTGRWVRMVEATTEHPVGWDRDNEPRWEYTVITSGARIDSPQELF